MMHADTAIWTADPGSAWLLAPRAIENRVKDHAGCLAPKWQHSRAHFIQNRPELVLERQVHWPTRCAVSGYRERRSRRQDDINSADQKRRRAPPDQFATSQ